MITKALVPPDRFDALFSRVMTLNPSGGASGRDSSEQKKIEALNPGLAAWEDVYEFLCEYAGARSVDGYSVLQFLLKEGEVKSGRRDAKVVTFDGNSFFACGDYTGAPVYGPGNLTAQQLGLNIPVVATALRRVAFPEEECGSGHIRWRRA